jgi:hypothetical protein
MKRLVIIVVGILLMSSCSIIKKIDELHPSYQYYSLEIFQTLDNFYSEIADNTYSYGLAKDSQWNVYKVVTYRPGDDYRNNFYDGKKISGRFIFIGTYSYETKDERRKTVPCLMPKKSYDYVVSHYGELADSILKIHTE